jgi:hypothetical protein
LQVGIVGNSPAHGRPHPAARPKHPDAHSGQH